MAPSAILKQSAVDTQKDVDRPMERTEASCSCATCPANRLNLCAIGKAWGPEAAGRAAASAQVARARRTICHPREWSEFVTVICSGWAASSITLSDGRRQILSFLLPGDVISTASIFGATSGRSVEAITDVTYRKFNRADIKAALFKNPDLFEKLARIWIEEKEQADQLAVDLGRRRADERVARQILYLAERLGKRDWVKGRPMQFPLRRRHLADATGLTPVHVSKTLSEFQRRRIVEIQNRSLAVIDMDELRKVALWG
jgi:CRP/FNR family transcriptional regulator